MIELCSLRRANTNYAQSRSCEFELRGAYSHCSLDSGALEDCAHELDLAQRCLRRVGFLLELIEQLGTENLHDVVARVPGTHALVRASHKRFGALDEGHEVVLPAKVENIEHVVEVELQHIVALADGA